MSRRNYGLMLVTVATVLWSIGGLFVRMLNLEMWTVLGWRALFGALTLGAVVLVNNRMQWRAVTLALGWRGGATAVVSGVSMFSYIAALKLTTVANVLSVYATVPFLAAGIAFLWTGERVERRVVLASAVAFVGVLVVAGFPQRPQDALGTALALLMTLTFAILVVTARRYPALQMAPANALGAALCALVSLPLMSGPLPSPGQIAILALFGFTTSALAFLLFLNGGRHIPSGEAGLIALLDVVLGPLWVWLAYAEYPGLAAMVGGGIILASVAWYLAAGLRAPAHAAGVLPS